MLERQLATIMVETGLDHFKAERAAKQIIAIFNEKVSEEINKREGLTEKERKLAAYFLEIASDEFSSHGCNDVDEDAWEGWTIEERQAFVKSWYEHNGNPEEFDENNLELGDDTIMGFLAYKLENI